MDSARSYESDDPCTTINPHVISSTGPQQRTRMAPNFLGFVVILAPHLLSSHVAAVPVGSSLQSRDDQGPEGHTVSLQIWVPVLVVGAIIVVFVLGWCQRGSVAAWLSHRRASQTTPSASTTRELTAEQLAGTINGATPPAAVNRPRRPRRPRRTPSQMSTTSLPAYAKEPGEQELVIFRGPEDMEDAGMPPATVVMEPLSEEGEESLHSRNNSSSQYPPLPGTPLDEPLLENDSAADLFRPRQSLETLDSSEEASSLMRSPTHDPRGEAPPYFEAIDLAPAQTSPLASASLPASSEPARRSGFRTLLHNLPNRLSMHGSSHAPSHSRADSSFSVASSDHVHGRETPQSRASHRPSVSGSGSLLSLAPFRSLSRQKSINNMNLTSPSLISLNSISSPLTHTLTRTEFTYPKSGPTPEQLKLISSRESFARFGRPYGADAIAFAASASRQDLEDIPPPDFDSEVHPAPGSAGPSRLRTTSNAQELQEDSGQDEPVLASSSTPAPRGASMRENSPAAAEADTVSSALDPFQIPLPSSPKAIEEPPPIEAELALLALPKHSTQASLALGPPTSYRAPSTFEERSESRASSLASFATAAESMAPLSASRFGLSDDEGDDNGDLTTSTTPTMAARHTLEPTDAIVTQSSQSPTVVAGSSQ